MRDEIIDKFVFEQLNNLDYTLLKRRINNRQVYIWGGDWKGLRIKEILNKNNIEVAGLLDNNQNLNCLTVSDIIKPKMNKNHYIIISMKLLHKIEILRVLGDAGFDEDDYYYPYDNLQFTWSCFKQNSIGYDDAKYERGRKIANSLSDDCMYFLLYGGHVGDTALAMSWYNKFKEYHMIKNIRLFVSENYKSIAGLYATENEIEIKTDCYLSDLAFYQSRSFEHKLNIVGSGWVWTPYVIDYPINQVVYKSVHLGLPCDYLSEIYDLKIEEQDKKNIFGDIDSKIAIIFPYAKSASELSSETWEKIVEILVHNKYRVYTNIGSEHEKTIDGTIPLKKGFVDTLKAVKISNIVMGSRSGIMDLIALGGIEHMITIHRTRTRYEKEYARVNSLYVNGEDSALYRNSMYEYDQIEEDIFIDNLLEKMKKVEK